MPLIKKNWPPGTLHKVSLDSKILANNPLGDPAKRVHFVWTPPNYKENSQKHYPVIYYLAAWGNSGQGVISWRAFNETLFERAARLISAEEIGDVIIAFPDCFTAYGGNQYVNSSATGQYADFITQEFIALVDNNFRTLPRAKHRALLGKSSGGYGALRLAMDNPNLFSCIASHAGDADFNILYRPEFPKLLTQLERFSLDRDEHHSNDGRVQRFLQHVWRSENLNSGEFIALMMLGMAASYDPDPLVENGFHLPIDIYTSSITQSAWDRWLEHDPVRRVVNRKAQLNLLSGIYIDAGRHDEHNLQYGNRHLSSVMKRRGIQHHYEEFNGGHRGIDYRFEISLPFIYERIKER